MAHCGCLSGQLIDYLCSVCQNNLVCSKCLQVDHKGHLVYSVAKVNQIMRPMIDAFELQEQQYQAFRQQLIKGQQKHLLEELEAAHLHFLGVLQLQVQIKKIGWLIKMGQLMLQHSYDYMRLLQFIADPARVKGETLKVNAQYVVFKKKVQSMKQRIQGVPVAQAIVRLSTSEQTVLRLKDQYLRYQSSIKIPPKSNCRRCSVNCWARYKACLNVFRHYLTCQCIARNWRIWQGPSGKLKCLGWLICCPCKLMGLCSNSSTYYCENPFYLCLCFNCECQCRICNIDVHPCPCCICMDAICACICPNQCCEQTEDCQCIDRMCESACCETCCDKFCGCLQKLIAMLCFCQLCECCCEAACQACQKVCQNRCCDSILDCCECVIQGFVYGLCKGCSLFAQCIQWSLQLCLNVIGKLCFCCDD